MADEVHKRRDDIQVCVHVCSSPAKSANSGKFRLLRVLLQAEEVMQEDEDEDDTEEEPSAGPPKKAKLSDSTD